MLLPKGTVFALVDGGSFELYRNSGTETEPRLAAIPVPTLEPTNFSIGARAHDSGARHQARTGDGSNDALDESAHVAAVTGWLNQQVLEQQIDQLVIVADPRSLGEMRRHYHKQLKHVLVGEVAKDMTGRPPTEIVRVLHR